MKIIIHLICSLLLISHASCKETREVKVTVTEEDGTPIQGARAQISFIGYTSEQSTRNIKLTDENGRHQASGTAPLRMKVMVSKDGYYDSVRGRLSKQKDHDVTIVLRKIKNPIPLYARNFRGKLPALGKDCGFDFKKADWVKPYGKGEQSDVIFNSKVIENSKGKFGGKLKVSNLNKTEGIVEINRDNGYLAASKMKMPNLAPIGGYDFLFSRNEYGYQNKAKPRFTSYFIKSRYSVENEETSYNYAKIVDGIKFTMGGGEFLSEPYRSKYPDEYAAVEFTYYFNPTPNDRNLEFDTSQNLFENLDTIEMVREP